MRLRLDSERDTCISGDRLEVGACVLVVQLAVEAFDC